MKIIKVDDIVVVDKTTVLDGGSGNHRSRIFGHEAAEVTISRFNFQDSRRFSAVVFQGVCVDCDIRPKNLSN